MTAIVRFAARPLITAQTGPKAVGSVIFLHGSGDTGIGVKEWVNITLGQEFDFRDLRVIFPTAPMRNYTPSGGSPSTVWFDRLKISAHVPEDLTTVEESCDLIGGIIDNEVKSGIPEHRIIVGGFSMGGCLALHIAYRHRPSLAGCFALSSFLNEDSSVFQHLKENPASYPPLFQCQGVKDPLVIHPWGKATGDALQRLGVDRTYYEYPDLYHELCFDELVKLRQWIENRITNSRL